MFRKKICIDLGTANTIVYSNEEGVVFEEPTVLAMATKTKEIIAIGIEAKGMLGKVSEEITACRPLQHGVIANFKITEKYLQYCMSLANPNGSRFFKPTIMLSSPAGITSVEERAIIEAATNAGAGKVYLLAEPLAAGIGAGLPISSTSGHMIVNIGGGTSEIAVISVNTICCFKSEKVAGDYINNKIVHFVKRKYGVLIGELLAENIKKTVGSAVQLQQPFEMEFRARDAQNSAPKTVRINSNDLLEGIEPSLQIIAKGVVDVLDKAPPELASDVIDRGMILSGGGAMLRGLDEYFSIQIGIPTHTAEDPIHCVIRGLATAIENIDALKRVIKEG